MITIYSADHRQQNAKAELIDGRLTAPFEKPDRAETILARVREVGLGEIVAPSDFGLDPVRRVHTDAFVEFLRTAYEEWRAAHGDWDALPLDWPCRGFRQIVPEAIDGRLLSFL